MPDHFHFIVQIPSGGRGATALPGVIANFKHLLSARYGIRFQRDFFDTRLRDDAHFAEKYEYVLGNPVRKGLCATPSDWPYSIAFSREGTAGLSNGRAVAPRPPRRRGEKASESRTKRERAKKMKKIKVENVEISAFNTTEFGGITTEEVRFRGLSEMDNRNLLR